MGDLISLSNKSSGKTYLYAIEPVGCAWGVYRQKTNDGSDHFYDREQVDVFGCLEDARALVKQLRGGGDE